MNKEIREQRDMIIKLIKKENNIKKEMYDLEFNCKKYKEFEKEIKNISKEKEKIQKKLTGIIMKDKGCNYITAYRYVFSINDFYNDKKILNVIYKNNLWNRSPYSKSYYNEGNINWGSKPEGSYRIADHWNFKSQGEIHCKMEDETKNNELLLCRYENGIYKIVRELKKDLMKIYD